MTKGLWGKKIGMTQIFSDNKVIPVTVIDTSSWFVTQIKTMAKDGYAAIQVARVRSRYEGVDFSTEWLKSLDTYFEFVREIAVGENGEIPSIGSNIDGMTLLNPGDFVNVTGTTLGRGFQGGVKRHGFSGGRASHGDKLGRKPGSLAGFRRQGRVPKGKKMPGHMGVDRCEMKNLEVVSIEPHARVVLVKGSVPGKSGFFVYLHKV